VIQHRRKEQVEAGRIDGPAEKIFGKGGQGLRCLKRTLLHILFSGGGYVNATVCVEDGKTKVNLVTQEWEYQAKEFLSQLP